MNRNFTQCLLMACLLLSIPALSVPAQSPQQARAFLIQTRQQLDDAILKGDLEKIHEARGSLERLLAFSPLQKWTHYYLGYADYRLSHLYQQTDRERAARLLDRAIEHLQKAIRLDNRFAEAYALLSSCLGQKIAYAPAAAMWLGPQSSQNMKAALSLEPDNPRVLFLHGLGLFFTPAAFGGSKTKAMTFLKNAIARFEQYQPPDSLAPTWGRPDAYAWLGVVYQERGDTLHAKKAYQQALAIAPDFYWVKQILLPGLTKTAHQ